MSTQESITEDEATSLAAAGLSPALLAPRHLRRAMDYYRAGFAAGREQPEPRVYVVGDPEPGPEVVAVLDHDDAAWRRDGDSPYWTCMGDHKLWDELLQFGPLVSCPRLPDYEAVVLAAPEGGAR